MTDFQQVFQSFTFSSSCGPALGPQDEENLKLEWQVEKPFTAERSSILFHGYSMLFHNIIVIIGYSFYF